MNSPILNRRKRRLVIKGDFQYRFTLRACLIASLIFLTFGAVLLLLIKSNFDMLREDALIQMPAFVDALRREYRLISLSTVTVLVLMTAFQFGLGLLLSSRVAGPLHALKRRLRDFSEGRNPVRLRLRQSDEFRNLEEVFNRSMEAHEERVKAVRTEIEKAIEDVRSLQPDSACNRLTEALKKL